MQVELLDSSTGALAASATTTEQGQFSLSWPAGGPRQVKVRVKALTVTPVIRVQDNTNSNALWAADSASVDNDTVKVLNLNIPSGWQGTGYGIRSAAPFAVLDAAYTAARSFLAERPVVFPDLSINWSPNNRSEVGDPALGQIVTSHWDGTQLWILGKADVDTDEYDSHIIAHEWGHYFESKLSRSDSPGGTHSLGNIKDPRLSWGEGWATALGAIVFYPDTYYVDTSGPQQSTSGLFFDIQDNGAEDPNPGWFSETSVMHVFLDLWDPSSASEPFDTVSLPLGALYDAMVGGQKNTLAFTTLFSFIDALKTANPASASAIDTLLAYRGVASPVADEVGSTEAHSGGLSGSLPVYNELIINASAATPLTFTSVGSDPELALNELGSNRFAYFVGDGTAVTVAAATSGPDVLIRLFRRGQPLAQGSGTGLASISAFATTAGAVYTVIITSTDATAGNVFAGAAAVSSP